MTQLKLMLAARRQRPSQKRRMPARGMTLLEVLAVVTIIAFVMGGAAFFIMPMFTKAGVKTATSSAQTIRKAVQVWQMTNGSTACPELETLISEKILDTGSDLDPWQEKFVLVCRDGEIIVMSSGPDKKAGTEDDIVVPKGAVVNVGS